MTHQNLYNSPCPNGAHHVDSMTYDFGWNGIRHAIIPNIRGLPSLDHALFLIKATEFHTSPMFHLFDEKTFMAKLYWFYEDPVERVHLSGLWFIHLLVLLALGKAFHGSKGTGNTPPGADLFARAFMLLPDYCYLWKEPCIAGELLSSIALYLQSIDWRTSAHNMVRSSRSRNAKAQDAYQITDQPGTANPSGARIPREHTSGPHRHGRADQTPENLVDSVHSGASTVSSNGVSFRY